MTKAYLAGFIAALTGKDVMLNPYFGLKDGCNQQWLSGLLDGIEVMQGNTKFGKEILE